MERSGVTAGEMIRIVAEALKLPAASVASYFRLLREEGLMTSGGRGRSAAKMTPLDVSRITIALMSADALLDVVAATKIFGQLRFVGISESEDLGRGRDTNKKVNVTLDVKRLDELPEELAFEQAVAELIQLRAGIAVETPWFIGDLHGRCRVEVNATRLGGRVHADGWTAFFSDPMRDGAVPSPDNWEVLASEDRLRARAHLGGLIVTRIVTERELAAMAPALDASSLPTASGLERT